MEDRYYPEELYMKDLQLIRDMSLSEEEKLEKSAALAHLFYNQGKEWMIDHLAIIDYRENILK
jgi:hypothetical protein